MTDIAIGPNNIAPKPTPVGCEQLPVTDGNFSADNTKAKAPHIASNVKFFDEALTFFLMEKKPSKTNGIQRAPQLILQPGDKYPSIMCIADTFIVGTNRIALITTAKQIANFLSLAVFINTTPNLINLPKKIKPS
jgi:hypothetical protein